MPATRISRDPTITTLTSGSGTYNLPTNCVRLRIRMCGSGGAGSSGGNGNASTFGSSLLIASGGSQGISGANATGGAGGTVTINSPAIAVKADTGGPGTGGGNDTTSNFPQGGNGGMNAFGGAGGGGYGESTGQAGQSGIANTGAGGGGNGSAGNRSSGGGGAGGYIEAIINSPSSSYPYSVGAAVGNGGSGVIIIEEFYQ